MPHLEIIEVSFTAHIVVRVRLSCSLAAEQEPQHSRVAEGWHCMRSKGQGGGGSLRILDSHGHT